MSDHALAMLIFGIIVFGTLVMTFVAARRSNSADEFWAAGGKIGPTQNALAISGDFLSASAFLGTTGLIFLVGFDGFVYLIIPLTAWIPIMLIYAQKMRDVGQYTLTDVLASRFRQPQLRVVLAVSTLTITGLYLLAQIVAAGALFGLLSGLSFNQAVLITAALMLVYVVAGGMVATTWVQMVKAVLLIAVLLTLTVLLLVRIGGNWGSWFDDATRRNVTDPILPGNLFGSGWNTLSAGLALAFGVVGLPHIVMRLFTVKDGRAARQSATRAVTIIGTATVLIIFVGLGARALLADQFKTLAATAGNLTVPMLGQKLAGGPGTASGSLMLAIVSAVAFATIIAVVAGLLINASSAVVRDLLGASRRLAARNERAEVRNGRIAAAVIAVVMAAVALAFGSGLNASVMVTLAFGVAASANFPALTLTLFWSRFTATGALVGITLGLLSSVVLLLLGPTLWLGSGPSPISLSDPTIVSMPIGFLGCIVGSLVGRRPVENANDDGAEPVAAATAASAVGDGGRR